MEWSLEPDLVSSRVASNSLENVNTENHHYTAEKLRLGCYRCVCMCTSLESQRVKLLQFLPLYEQKEWVPVQVFPYCILCHLHSAFRFVATGASMFFVLHAVSGKEH